MNATCRTLPRECAPPPTTRTGDRRRGIAIIAVIVLLLVVGLIIVGMVLGTGRDQDLTMRRLETVNAFYAAEAGMNMAMREYNDGNDDDGDGTIGTISDDANDANDPAFGSDSRVVVTSASAGGFTTLTSTGRCGQAVRRIDAVVR